MWLFSLMLFVVVVVVVVDVECLYIFLFLFVFFFDKSLNRDICKIRVVFVVNVLSLCRYNK